MLKSEPHRTVRWAFATSTVGVQTEGTQQLASVDIWERDRLLTGRLSLLELQHSWSCPLQQYSLGSEDSEVCLERLSHIQWKLRSKLPSCLLGILLTSHTPPRSEKNREVKHTAIEPPVKWRAGMQRWWLTAYGHMPPVHVLYEAVVQPVAVCLLTFLQPFNQIGCVIFCYFFYIFKSWSHFFPQSFVPASCLLRFY